MFDGVVTPAFIHNGSYFFVNLSVYAGGLVDCWEMVDLPLFEEKWTVDRSPGRRPELQCRGGLPRAS